MIRQFCVSNYRNFKDTITLDFSKVGGYQFNQNCLSNGLIGKILVYGRNATGKTNLGRAIMDITMSTRAFADERDAAFTNADSQVKQADFSYVFQFDEDIIDYKYSKSSEGDLLFERCLLNGQEIYWCDYQKESFSFHGLKLIHAETAITERFVAGYKEGNNEDSRTPKMSFLKWIFSNVALSSNSAFLKLDSFIGRMKFISNISVTGFRPKRMYARFFELLSAPDELKQFERFMNIMGVDGSYVTKRLPDGTWELYFKHKRLIPFYENASSGTIALMNLYRRLVVEKESSFVYMDEFDAFYHYEMSCKLVQFFREEYPNCQIVFTTHNTNLMTNRLIRPDCVMILSSKGYLTPLCNATERELREGHNLEKMYISGEFERYE